GRRRGAGRGAGRPLRRDFPGGGRYRSAAPQARGGRLRHRGASRTAGLGRHADACGGSERQRRVVRAELKGVTMDLWQYDATDLPRLIRMGRAWAKETVDSVLGRLHKVNPAINAVVRVYEAEARAAADTADAVRARGHALPPLHGVPATIKIN